MPERAVRRYVFCATFLQVALTGRYPAHCPAEFGLSSRLRPRGLRRASPISRRETIASRRAPNCEAAISGLRGGVSVVSCVIPYCSSFLYRLLRGVPITSAVFEMFQLFSRSLPTRNARSADSLNSRSVPGVPSHYPGRPAWLQAGRCRGGRRRRSLSPGVMMMQPLDGVPQLADVALPARLLHVLERRGREPLRPRGCCSRLNRSAKCRTSGGMSSRRSRSGGTRIGMTLRRK